MLPICWVAVAFDEAASRATIDGLKEQVGGVLPGAGETLHARLTMPVKPPNPLTVRVAEPL